MKNLFYLFLIVPFKCCISLSLKVLVLSFCFVTLLYSIGFEILLEHEIFNAKPSDIEKIVQWKPENNTVIYDREGNLISEQYNKFHHYIPYHQIPSSFIQTILAIEDRKYFEHKGIDILGIIRASVQLVKNNSYTQGASTITQQVVKNLLLTKEKTIKRKLREITLSLYLEQVLSKEKILEIYCNQMFLGYGSYGIGAASKRYFNKTLNELSLAEMALIAGLFQSPGQNNPVKNPEEAKKRQIIVLTAMQQAGFITDAEKTKHAKSPLTYHIYQSKNQKIAPYFTDYVLSQSQKILKNQGIKIKDSGLKIYTTLADGLQRLGEQTFKESQDIFQLMKRHIRQNSPLTSLHDVDNKVQASMLVLDRKSGQILAMIGGRNYFESQFNRTSQSLRAPGSLFKPITYSLALKRKKNWNDLSYISPITIGNYRPRTEEIKLYSETTLLEAFYKSINYPAVALGQEIGIRRIINYAKKLGIDSPIKEEAASLLGSSEVTMLDMANVYQTFSNDGTRAGPYAITKILNSEGEILYEAKTTTNKIQDSITNELIVEGLKQVVRRGTGYKISHLSGYAAGKTGTSNNSRDNWFAGFTNDLVVVTWLGTDEQNPFSGAISASNTAAPLWGRFVSKTLKHLKTRRLSQPKKLQAARVHRTYGHLDPNGIRMYFKPGTAPKKNYSDLMRINQGDQVRISLNEF